MHNIIKGFDNRMRKLCCCCISICVSGRVSGPLSLSVSLSLLACFLSALGVRSRDWEPGERDRGDSQQGVSS